MGAALITVMGMLVLSAFFSGMEIAFVSSNRLRLEIDKRQSPTLHFIADLFARHPSQYITTILVGNNIALVVYSLYMSVVLQAFARWAQWTALADGSIVLETVISTVIIIFTAEFLPKSVVKANPNFFYRALAVPVFIFYLLLYPIARLTTWLSWLALRLVGQRVKDAPSVVAFNRGDLAALLEEEPSTPEHEPGNEFRLFQNALEFPDRRVRDCMVPRVDVEAVDASTPIALLAERFASTQYTRIFVYEGDVDHIVGYVNSKSLFREPRSLTEVLMEVHYVPEAMPLQQLMRDFIRRRSNIAVVIDEFGGTAGIISLEDVLEQIFGEIEDEHDAPEMVEKRVADGEWVFSARMEVDYLNERYGLEIPQSRAYDTLAGFILFHNQGIPKPGEVITIGPLQIRILRTTASRIDLVRVKYL